MVRFRTAVIACMLLSLLFQEGLYPKAPKRAPRQHAYKKHRHVKARKKKPKAPRPELEWKECGDRCLARIFDNNISPVRIAPVKGELRDIALHGSNIYLLVKNFNLIADAIFVIRKETGKIKSIWGIGRHDAEAMTCDGGSLWIVSRSEKYFLRKITFSGKAAGDIGIRSLPEGSINGLASAGGSFVFSARAGEKSNLYSFDGKGGTMKRIGSFHGMVNALTCFGGRVILHVEEAGPYSNQWLMIMNPDGSITKKMSFINATVASLSCQGDLVYVLDRRSNGSAVFSVAVLEDANLVLADPRIQRVSITIPLASANTHPYSADLWVPYPLNRSFQNVRRISIDPKPREITDDSFGNRWARVRWDRITGNARAVLTFDIITCAVSYTVDPGYVFNEADLPNEVREYSRKETSAFDISHYVVKSHSTRIDTNGTYLARILSIRDYISGAIRYSAYDDRWGRASDYLFRGRGDAYGQTVSFAAISRVLGVPARAAGGFVLEGPGREQGGGNAMTWDQVFVPGTGWIDIGIGRDYDHTRESFAYRPNRYFLSFEGDFDTSDYSDVFTHTEWGWALRWSSADERRKADVKIGPAQISVEDLKE